MYNLFLDDERVPYSPNGSHIDVYYYTHDDIYINHDWVIVRSYDQFIDYITKNGLPKIVSFDHDLSDEHYQYLINHSDVNYNKYTEKTGMECLKWLCEYCLDNNKKLPKCLIHTQNIIGSINMKKYIENFNKYHR